MYFVEDPIGIVLPRMRPNFKKCIHDRLSSSTLSARDRMYHLVQSACEIADGIAFLHRCNVVHMDISLRNILCGPNEKPYIADFGLARILHEGETEVPRGTGVWGLFGPEEFQKVTYKVDIRALGVLVVELIPPFEHQAFPVIECDAPNLSETEKQRRTFEAVTHHYRERSKDKMSSIVDPGVIPVPIWNVVQDLIHDDPEKRPDAIGAKEKLQEALHVMGITQTEFVISRVHAIGKPTVGPRP